MNYLDTWKTKTLEAIDLEAQAQRARVEAEYAMAAHKAFTYGPTPAIAKSAAAVPAKPEADVSEKPICETCHAAIKDSKTEGGWTAKEKAEYSLRKHGKVLCYKCEQNLRLAA